MNDGLFRAGAGSDSFRIEADGPGTGGSAKLDLIGNLDADGAPMLSEALERLLVRRILTVVLDVAAVGFISSSGIGALVAAIGEFRDEGGDIRLVHVPPPLRRVFEALDLLDYVSLDAGGS
jgi:anti-sigma B factor antagonist